jgi:hypothetical protein
VASVIYEVTGAPSRQSEYNQAPVQKCCERVANSGATRGHDRSNVHGRRVCNATTWLGLKLPDNSALQTYLSAAV